MRDTSSSGAEAALSLGPQKQRYKRSAGYLGRQSVPGGAQPKPLEVGQQPWASGMGFSAQAAASSGRHSHVHVLWFKIPPKQLQGEQFLGHSWHTSPVQLPLQHSLSVVQETPVDRHVAKQLAHLPLQSQGWFSRWRRRSRLLTQRVTALAKSHSSVSRSKGTWQMRTQSSSARAREGISAAMAVPAKSFSA